MSTPVENVSTLSVADSILGAFFNKLAINFLLLRIFEHCLLRWKLDFRGYNLGSKISSFGLVKIEIIVSEVDRRILKNLL